MRIEQLEYLDAVARLSSFRNASEELHVSQSALSETVRKLESELGVSILDRGRSGVSISTEGQEIMPHIHDVIESVDRLRQAAGNQQRSSRVVRLGVTATATAPLLTPTMRQFTERYPATEIEFVAARQRSIHQDLRDGNLDLGLVNYLVGDDMPPDLQSAELLRGKPVLCVHPESPLATSPGPVRPAELANVPLIVMRGGYAMNRYIHRLMSDIEARFTFSADGAEMGKLMVAEGLGATVLADFSILGDPLERAGAIVVREIEDDTEAIMVIQRRARPASAGVARDLHQMLVERGDAFMTSE